jgi:hypothetical protein
LAVSNPPAPLPNAVTSTPAPVREQSSRASEQQTQAHDRRAKATVGGSKVANQAQTGGVIESQSVAGLPAQARNLASLKNAQPRSPIEPANKLMQNSSGVVTANSVVNGAVPPQASAANTKDFLQQNGSGGGLGNLRDRSAAATPPAPQAMALGHAEIAGAPAPRASSQTVEVTGAAPIATLSTISNSLIFNQTKNILATHPLPSGLPALSIVSTANQTLAIDTHNTLFFSDDNGTHWKTVPSQWQGRAVKVGLASAVHPAGSLTTSDANSARVPSNDTAIGGATQSPPAKSTLTGTVTDATGAVIADASVILSNGTTPNVRTVKTGRDGRYLVDNLVPGSYQVEAHALGFNARQLAVTLAPSQQSLANITLPVGQAAESVTVDASAISLEAPALVKRKTAEPVHSDAQLLPLFEITTDTGDRWTSSDGQTWKRQ